jgi:2',3'-cyclic-nucleotide 2'-phosphodiesterase (5'-nucleotidase family)
LRKPKASDLKGLPVRHLTVLIALFFLFATACATTPTAPPKKHLSVLYFGDLQGKLEAYPAAGEDRLLGGAPRLLSLIKRIRQENDGYNVPTLVLYAGEVIGDNNVGRHYKGEAMVRLLNHFQVDGASVGKRDLMFGRTHHNQLVKKATFPWIVSNLRETGRTAPWLPLGFTRRFPTGINVGVVGVTDDSATKNVPADQGGHFEIDPPSMTAQVALSRTGGPGSVDVLLSHCDATINAEIAAEAKDLRALIVDGGDPKTSKIVGGVYIVGAGSGGQYLGRLDFEKVGKTITVLRHKAYPVTQKLPEDRVTRALVDGFLNGLK